MVSTLITSTQPFHAAASPLSPDFAMASRSDTTLSNVCIGEGFVQVETWL